MGKTLNFKGMLQGKEVWLVKLKGIDTPEAAEAFKAQCLLMPEQDRPALEDEEEFYVQELVGMQVTTSKAPSCALLIYTVAKEGHASPYAFLHCNAGSVENA